MNKNSKNVGQSKSNTSQMVWHLVVNTRGVVNLGGKQRMMGQKASRLFLQIARGVSTSQSRMELGTTLASGESTLCLLLEGSVAGEIPAPPTQQRMVGMEECPLHLRKGCNLFS